MPETKPFQQALFPAQAGNCPWGGSEPKYAAFFDPPPHKAAEDRKGLELGEGETFPKSHLPLSGTAWS